MVKLKHKPGLADDDQPLSLDMSFDEALEMLLNTPPPDDEEPQQEERNQDDCD